MKIQDYPEHLWLGKKAEQQLEIVDLIDATVKPGETFTDLSSFSEDNKTRVSHLTRRVYEEEFGSTNIPSQALLDEPLYFSFAVAEIIQKKPTGILLPHADREQLMPFTTTNVEGYLQRYSRLDLLIQLYIERISGGVGYDTHPNECPPQVEFARMMSGTAFLLIDISNALEYEDRRNADLAVVAEMEKHFEQT